MRKRRVNQKPNTGSSLLVVLIAMALIGILAVMALTMSMANFQMKQVDKGAKKNFYSAENALDELRAGLEEDVSNVIEKSYTEVMLKYASKPVGERNELFKTTLGYELAKKFDALGIVGESNWASINTKYKIDDLEKYLDKTKDNTTITAKNGMNELECLYVSSDSKKQYVEFRNVNVEYLEPTTKFYSQITTDLKISIPNANFEAIGDRPAYSEYAAIANRQLLMNDSGSALIQGNVYAGNHGIFTSIASSLQIKANQVVVDGSINANEGGKITIEDPNPGDTTTNNIWTRDIVTTAASSVSGIQSKINLAGNLYVADDVAINAPNSIVKLSGSYYGYGNENTPKTSSAMVVNRKDSILDLTDLKDIFIAGRAYIEPAEENQNSGSVRTGEAISLKGNQMAYLLPGDCIGIRPGKVNAGHNPISRAEYQSLKDDMEKDSSILEVNLDYVLEFSGKKLSYYVDPVQPFITIFDTTNTSSLVYYYPNFKNEFLANEYFNAYISESENMNTVMQRLEDMNSYIRLPANILNNSSNGRKTYAGNLVAYSDSGNKLIRYNNSVDAQLPLQFANEANDLKAMYKAYTRKLVPSMTYYPLTEQNYDNLFESLIIENSGDATHGGIYELVEDETPGANSSYLFPCDSYGKFMLVTNAKTTAEDEFDDTNAFVVDSSIDPEVHIIIATGDVEVDTNFHGLIISKGIIRINNGASITADPEQVFNLICNTKIRTVFRDYNSFAMYMMDDKNKQIEIGSLITEENWTKN